MKSITHTVHKVVTILVFSLGVALASGDLPKLDDLGTRRLSPLPQPGVHPRVLCTAADLPDIKRRLTGTALGYGLCSRGTEGVKTKRCRLVMPRAHDCITLLLGSKERYAEYVQQNPGTYWYSPGWNRHALMPGQERYEKLRRVYVEKYGEDNADYLMESEQHWFKTYNNAAFVHLGCGDINKELAYT